MAAYGGLVHLMHLFNKRQKDKDLLVVVYKLVATKVEELFGLREHQEVKEYIFLDFSSFLQRIGREELQADGLVENIIANIKIRPIQ
jgi:uncharacterized protein Yka (UPF0111/DUF47 family)